MPVSTDNGVVLVVPLDASSVTDFKPERGLKVALVGAEGTTLMSQQVVLDDKGQGEAKFALQEAPGELRVLVGPDDASDDEIVGLQTLGVSVSAKLFIEPRLVLPPLRITDFYWHHWLRWCRWYTVRGRVLCADGSPVPGATVCAHDVDGLWNWLGTQQVGCATTDASGSFSMTFRWCCGWYPWWWWRMRDWRFDPDIWARIRRLIEVEPRLPIPPRPTVRPSLDVFDALLADGPLVSPPLGLARAGFDASRLAVANAPRLATNLAPLAGLPTLKSATGLAALDFDPSQLSGLRERLTKVLPASAELEKLQIWPWYPREPWFDCEPDIAFRVTQQCDGQEKVIVDEPWWRARWNIDTTLDVTLVATSDACCVRTPPQTEGNCMVLSSVCGISVSDIGGNVSAPAMPAGFAHPGLVSVVGDAPFAGDVRLEGQFGSAASVDYYEFEVAPTALGPWAKLAVGSAGGFSRRYFDSATLTFPAASFPFQFIDGRYVIESREHYEDTHPAPWGITQLWTGQNFDTLMVWDTDGHYDNGEYHLRLVGYDRVGDTLQNERIVPLCGTEDADPPQQNHLVLQLDNRTTGTALDPSGDEPRAKVVEVRINGVVAGPCDIAQAPADASLDVYFIAYDVDAHLSQYSLVATFGADEPPINLLAVVPPLGALPNGNTLTGVALDGVPAAVQVGPTYPAALDQGAVSPAWSGGGLHLHIADLRSVIERSCCYQIELWAYKRTIVGCNGNLPHRDFSFYSLTIAV